MLARATEGFSGREASKVYIVSTAFQSRNCTKTSISTYRLQNYRPFAPPSSSSQSLRRSVVSCVCPNIVDHFAFSFRNKLPSTKQKRISYYLYHDKYVKHISIPHVVRFGLPLRSISFGSGWLCNFLNSTNYPRFVCRDTQRAPSVVGRACNRPEKCLMHAIAITVCYHYYAIHIIKDFFESL